MTSDATRLQDALESMRRSRASSQDHAERAVSALLSALRGVLGGERLAGMPNLGSSAAPLYAAPVRVKAGAHTRVPLNFDAKTPTLVLTDYGELALAQQNDGGDWGIRSVLEEELRADDPEKLANTIIEAIEAHCRRSERSVQRFDRLAKFSRRLWEVCEYEEE